MKKFMWVALVTLLGAASGLAQDVCVGGSQPSDQERFVRAEIQSRSRRVDRSDRGEGFRCETHYFAPDLTVKLADGTVLDR